MNLRFSNSVVGHIGLAVGLLAVAAAGCTLPQRSESARSHSSAPPAFASAPRHTAAAAIPGQFGTQSTPESSPTNQVDPFGGRPELIPRPPEFAPPHFAPTHFAPPHLAPPHFAQANFAQPASGPPPVRLVQYAGEVPPPVTLVPAERAHVLETPAAHVPHSLPLSDTFVQTDVQQVVLTLANQAGVSVVLDERVTGVTSAIIENEPFEAALRKVLLPLGYIYRYRDGQYLIGVPPHPRSRSGCSPT